jgi:hypothetical protein
MKPRAHRDWAARMRFVLATVVTIGSISLFTLATAGARWTDAIGIRGTVRSTACEVKADVDFSQSNFSDDDNPDQDDGDDSARSQTLAAVVEFPKGQPAGLGVVDINPSTVRMRVAGDANAISPSGPSPVNSKDKDGPDRTFNFDRAQVATILKGHAGNPTLVLDGSMANHRCTFSGSGHLLVEQRDNTPDNVPSPESSASPSPEPSAIPTVEPDADSSSD